MRRLKEKVFAVIITVYGICEGAFIISFGSIPLAEEVEIGNVGINIIRRFISALFG